MRCLLTAFLSLLLLASAAAAEALVVFDQEEEVSFDDEEEVDLDALDRSVAVPEHEPELWLTILPLLGLGLLACNVRWRGRAQEKR